MTTEVLGGFEHQVLLAVLQIGEETYTVPIVEEIEARTGREVAAAAVFVTLRRLERRGLLESRKVPLPAGRGGRPRRMFRPLPEAVVVLRQSKRQLSALWEGLGALDDT